MMAQEIRRKQVSSVALRILRLSLLNGLQSKEKIFSQSVALLREGTQRQQQPLLLALAIARKVMLLGGNPGTKSGD